MVPYIYITIYHVLLHIWRSPSPMVLIASNIARSKGSHGFARVFHTSHTHSGNGFATDKSLVLPTSLLLVIATKQTLSTVQQGYAGWRSYGMQGARNTVHIHTYIHK